jgi:hypothetical protein
MGIPYLFVDNEQQYFTRDWYKLLSSSDREYEHCQVVSLTWVKAMHSEVSHEFIQFIVEDTRNGNRTRVFSDRTNHPEPDRVIVGRDWGSAFNPSGQTDLPLPLRSLIFTRTKFPVILLAKYLSMITEAQPAYHIYSTMCFWYAETVFTFTKMTVPNEQKEWPFARFSSKLLCWEFIWSNKHLVATIENAQQFKQQNIEGMSYQVPLSSNMKKPLSVEEYSRKIADMLSDEENMKQYAEALHIDESEQLSSVMVSDCGLSRLS